MHNAETIDLCASITRQTDAMRWSKLGQVGLDPFQLIKWDQKWLDGLSNLRLRGENFHRNRWVRWKTWACFCHRPLAYKFGCLCAERCAENLFQMRNNKNLRPGGGDGVQRELQKYVWERRVIKNCVRSVVCCDDVRGLITAEQGCEMSIFVSLLLT